MSLLKDPEEKARGYRPLSLLKKGKMGKRSFKWFAILPFSFFASFLFSCPSPLLSPFLFFLFLFFLFFL